MPITQAPPNLNKLRRQNLAEESNEFELNPEITDTPAEADKPRYRTHNSAEELQETLRINSILSTEIYKPSLQNLRENIIDENTVSKDDIQEGIWLDIEKSEEAIRGSNSEKFAEQGTIYFNAEKPQQVETSLEEFKPAIDLKLGQIDHEETKKNPSHGIDLVDFKLFGGFLLEGFKATTSFLSFKNIKEASTGILDLFTGRSEKQAPVETDPQKVEKGQEEARKKANIRQNINAQRAQMSEQSAERIHAEENEVKNVNSLGKIGQELYRGVKDAFGRITAYAQSLFERGKLEEEEKQKKAQKQSSMQQATRASSPTDDVARMDKVDGQSGIVGANASAG